MSLYGLIAQCRVQGEVYRLLGAVLVVKSDSSRKEGPAIPLLNTLRVYQSVAEGWCVIGGSFYCHRCCEQHVKGVFPADGATLLIQIPLKPGSTVSHFVASGLVSIHFMFLACCDEPLLMFLTREWLRFLCWLPSGQLHFMLC